MIILELLKEDPFFSFDDEDDEDLEEEFDSPIQIRRLLSKSKDPEGAMEMVIDVSNIKYINVKQVRVKIQANYQSSNYSKKVELNVRNIRDEKLFLENLAKMVKDSNGKGVRVKDVL